MQLSHEHHDQYWSFSVSLHLNINPKRPHYSLKTNRQTENFICIDDACARMQASVCHDLEDNFRHRPYLCSCSRQGLCSLVSKRLWLAGKLVGILLSMPHSLPSHHRDTGVTDSCCCIRPYVGSNSGHPICEVNGLSTDLPPPPDILFLLQSSSYYLRKPSL